MASTHIDVLILRLGDIQKQLGGPLEKAKDAKQDEFNVVKLKLVEYINKVTKKQEERDKAVTKEGRNVRIIRMEAEIRESFDDLNLQLKQMKDILRRQKKNPKKFPVSQTDIKEKQCQKYGALVQHIIAKEDGERLDTQEQPITLTEMKLNLYGEKGVDRSAVERELNDIEGEALVNFKKRDQEIDGMLDQAGAGLDVLREKALRMGEALDYQEIAIEGLDEEVNKANERLVTANARLKKLVYEYRKPSKFCCDMLLILLLLGLIGIIIKMATTKSL